MHSTKKYSHYLVKTLNSIWTHSTVILKLILHFNKKKNTTHYFQEYDHKGPSTNSENNNLILHFWKITKKYLSGVLKIH